MQAVRRARLCRARVTRSTATDESMHMRLKPLAAVPSGVCRRALFNLDVNGGMLRGFEFPRQGSTSVRHKVKSLVDDG
jgi:hypothetical protein